MNITIPYNIFRKFIYHTFDTYVNIKRLVIKNNKSETHIRPDYIDKSNTTTNDIIEVNVDIPIRLDIIFSSQSENGKFVISSMNKSRINIIYLKPAIINKLVIDSYNLQTIKLYIEKIYNEYKDNTIYFAQDLEKSYRINKTILFGKDPTLIDKKYNYYFKVKDNIISIDNFKIYYPYKINYSFEKELNLNFKLNFNDAGSNFIEKTPDCDTVFINYSTPVDILIKFINAIDIYNNIDEFIINDVVDMLKYI